MFKILISFENYKITPINKFVQKYCNFLQSQQFNAPAQIYKKCCLKQKLIIKIDL